MPRRTISRHSLKLELDNRVRDIEYCRLENIRFEPGHNSFQYVNGRWLAEHTDFPIDDDNDLDVMIIVTGNPGLTPRIIVTIDDRTPVARSANERIGNNGRTFFRFSISL